MKRNRKKNPPSRVATMVQFLLKTQRSLQDRKKRQSVYPSLPR